MYSVASLLFCLNFDLLQLSGFAMEVVETAYAGHAKVLASTVDLSTCPDGNINCISAFATAPPFHFSILKCVVFTGIICVGGDGVVNEVLLASLFI